MKRCKPFAVDAFALDHTAPLTPPVDVHEQRVLRQLLEALLFEGIVPYQYQRHHSTISQHETGQFTFQLDTDVYQAIGYIGGFGRVRLQVDTILVSRQQNSDVHWQTPSISHIVHTLPIAAEAQTRLLRELQHTISLCRWNTQHLYESQPSDSLPKTLLKTSSRTSLRREMSATQLESAIHEGHPYHPCFKSRTGFSVDDHYRYGPEAGQHFQLHWLAVRRSCLVQALPDSDDASFWINELGASHWSDLHQRLVNNGCHWGDYTLLPVHPWQWHECRSHWQVALAAHDLVSLGEGGDEYVASLSVRTLINVSQPHKAQIKLPLAMVNSSSLRIIESHSITSAPALSQWLQTIIDRDAYFSEQQPFGIQAEYAGIRINEQAAEWCEEWADYLGVIFRQSVEELPLPLGHKKSPTTVLPVAALALIEADGLPFIDPWIQRYGCHNWLNALLNTLLLPGWHLLVHHGIGLELHAQNSLLQHSDGWPVGLLARDFHESLEYVPSYLADPSLAPDFSALHPNYAHAPNDRYYWMASVEALRELWVDTALVFNLAELAHVLAQHYDFAESQFWQQVQTVLCDYADSGVTSSERLAQMDIWQPSIQTESLLKKKFDGRNTAEFHHHIANPLANPLPQKASTPSTPLPQYKNPLSVRNVTPMFRQHDIIINGRVITAAMLAQYQQQWLERIQAANTPPQTQPKQPLRIALCHDDTAQWLALCLLAIEKHWTVMPIHPSTPEPQVIALARQGQCQLVFTQYLQQPLSQLQLQPQPQPQPQCFDAAAEYNHAPAGLIQMSSGTTGAAKCLLRSWDSIATEIEAYNQHVMSAMVNTQPVIACPVTHSYGLISGVLTALARGHTPHIVTNINPKFLIKTLRRYSQPVLYTSPVMLLGLLTLWPVGSTLYSAMISGSLMRADGFVEILSGEHPRVEHLHQQYGCSEAGCISVALDVQAANDIGVPLPHWQVSCSHNANAPTEIIVQPNSAYFDTDSLSTGSTNANTNSSSVIYTQDVGYWHSDLHDHNHTNKRSQDTHNPSTRLHFVARQDDTIIVAGLNVYPKDVEEVVLAHPQINDAVVFAVEDQFAGQRVGCQYVCDSATSDTVRNSQDGFPSVSGGELRRWCSEHLAHYQLPNILEPVATIPRHANGKIRRRDLAAAYQQVQRQSKQQAQENKATMPQPTTTLGTVYDGS